MPIIGNPRIIRARSSFFLVYIFFILLGLFIAVKNREYIFLLFLSLVFTLYSAYNFFDVLVYRIEISKNAITEYRFFKKISEVNILSIIQIKRNDSVIPIIFLLSPGRFGPGSAFMTVMVENVRPIFKNGKRFYYYLPNILENLKRRDITAFQKDMEWTPTFSVSVNNFLSTLYDSGLRVQVDQALKQDLSFRLQKHIFGAVGLDQIIIRSILYLIFITLIILSVGFFYIVLRSG